MQNKEFHYSFQCEKLRKKRSSLVGAFVSTHGKSIDEVDKSIVEARTALNEVTTELQERVHRWKQIELLCGFNIINNNGIPYLENILYRGAPNGRSLGPKGMQQYFNSFREIVCFKIILFTNCKYLFLQVDIVVKMIWMMT